MGYRCLVQAAAAATAATAVLMFAPALPGNATTRPKTGELAVPGSSASYRGRTLDNSRDRSYNQLTSINKNGLISGFYGAGGPGHPSNGYLLKRPYRQSDYIREDFPRSAQTRVLAVNDNGVIVGTFSYTDRRSGNVWYGFWAQHGQFHKVDYRTPYRSRLNQLCGVNDSGIAVGVYLDRSGNDHAFRYNIATGSFSLPVRGAAAFASNINNKGAVVGYFKKAGLPWISYVTYNGGLRRFSVPRAGQTAAQGINDHGVIVGGCTRNNKSFGFIRGSGGHLRLYVWGSAAAGMAINGINDSGDLVGWYVGSNGSVNGFLAIP